MLDQNWRGQTEAQITKTSIQYLISDRAFDRENGRKKEAPTGVLNNAPLISQGYGGCSYSPWKAGFISRLRQVKTTLRD